MKVKIFNNSISSFLVIALIGLLFWSFSSKEKLDTEHNQSSKKIYCQLYVNNRYVNDGYVKRDINWVYKIEVHYGNYINYPNKEEESHKVKTFTFYLDALNYLSEQGWHLVLTKRHMVDGYLHYEDFYILEKTIQ